MATHSLPAPSGRAMPSFAHLQAMRAAHVERVAAAAERRMSKSVAFEGMPGGMPSKLFAAGCFLAAAGLPIEQCDGERWFGVEPAVYTEMLTANAEVGEQLVEEGRKAFFGKWKPIVSAELAAEIERSVAMSNAWDEMASAAGKFDGSFETAKERFWALAGMAHA
ncbi:MAG: hypothetical protein JOY99_01590 [Sphingomonadaceae bacterium]|nr:hypothetical protein [Sphingomonadaceae bacterium]